MKTTEQIIAINTPGIQKELEKNMSFKDLLNWRVSHIIIIKAEQIIRIYLKTSESLKKTVMLSDFPVTSQSPSRDPHQKALTLFNFSI
jgi:hypothetical protein